MAVPQKGTIGISPPGALGVSLFYHLTHQLARVDGSVCFFERAGSTSAESLREQGRILIADARQVHEVPTAHLLKPDLLASYDAGWLPEILLICPNPDQLLGVITTGVELLERIHERGELQGDSMPMPVIVLSSNGIYFQRLRQIFLEKLEEATLLGRLPDLWPDLMPRIVGRFLRGVTIQTGLREGSGAASLYRPGPKGITRLAGGDARVRERCCQVLVEHGGWFELAAHSSATRLEFDKAMVNLATNLLGQLYAIDDSGRFSPLRVEQIMVAEHEAEIQELTRHVFRVGQAVKVYGRLEDFGEAYEKVLESCRLHATHVPSSLQWVGLNLRLGRLEPALTPTETWLLDPLIRYARSAGLDETVRYFESLKERLLRKLVMAGEAGGRET